VFVCVCVCVCVLEWGHEEVREERQLYYMRCTSACISLQYPCIRFQKSFTCLFQTHACDAVSGVSNEICFTVTLRWCTETQRRRRHRSPSSNFILSARIGRCACTHTNTQAITGFTSDFAWTQQQRILRIFFHQQYHQAVRRMMREQGHGGVVTYMDDFCWWMTRWTAARWRSTLTQLVHAIGFSICSH
jgi:hypothetical protein